MTKKRSKTTRPKRRIAREVREGFVALTKLRETEAELLFVKERLTTLTKAWMAVADVWSQNGTSTTAVEAKRQCAGSVRALLSTLTTVVVPNLMVPVRKARR